MKSFFTKSNISANVELALMRGFWETKKKNFNKDSIRLGDTIYILTTGNSDYPIAIKAEYIAREPVDVGSFWHDPKPDVKYVERVYFRNPTTIEHNLVSCMTNPKRQAGSDCFVKLT